MSKITPYVHIKCNGNANDISGNGNHGTVYGASLTDDRFGHPNSAYNFDGTDDYIELPHVLSGANKFTIVCWVKTTQQTSGSFRYTDPVILGTGQLTGISADFLITNYNGNFAWLDEFYTSRVSHDTGEFIADGIWHQLIVVRNGENLYFYLDGVNVGEDSTGSNTVRDSPIYLGHSDDTLYYDGMIDDVRIYNQPLTPTQVDYIYTMTKRKYGRR
jgi:hypothetical protein